MPSDQSLLVGQAGSGLVVHCCVVNLLCIGDHRI